MFYGQCNDCGQRWELGTASTCVCKREHTTEDQALDLALEALENVTVTGPDDDGIVWINLPGNGTTGKAILRVGKAGLIAAQCAQLYEEQRTKAITAIKQALAAQQEHEPENEPHVSLASVQEPVMEYPDYTPGVGWRNVTPPAAPVCTRSHPHENMNAMCELRTEIARLTNENARLKAPPAPVPDYAWPTVADYEKDVGFEVNKAFKMAWVMARTTNDLFTQMGKNT